ncbi:Bacterial SH3 domain protein [Flavobacterium columnare]|uniref:Bacterial SH3 domain protein n=1 Tax=Flavobacterium columnare TaxID=996 RepID=A0A2N9PCA9_9FLAO|nr:SH3 domain-containing protein [Flavobacterium columnare]SPE77971.1 Bacterial SH3 domain protein [Flavobacterium columnare]
MKKFIYLALIVACFSCKKDNYITNNFNDSNKEDTSKLNNQVSNSLENQENSVEFGNLFNEGSQINFTPSDLVTPSNEEQKEFKKKLVIYEKNDPMIDGISTDDLLTLINNDTFFDSKSYIDSSWLDYFLTKYDLYYTYNDLMEKAIKQEDLNAVNILINHKYIISKKEIEIVKETKEGQEFEISQNKKDGYDSYLVENSKIDLIKIKIEKLFHSNKIYDKDGYTNLREDKSANSKVTTKINSGEYISVITNSDEEDWCLVETKDGKKGYVHKSRIVSK